MTAIDATHKERISALEAKPELLAAEEIRWVNGYPSAAYFNTPRTDKAGMPYDGNQIILGVKAVNDCLVEALKARKLMVANTAAVFRAMRQIEAGSKTLAICDADGTLLDTNAQQAVQNCRHYKRFGILYRFDGKVYTSWTAMQAGTCGRPFGVQVQGDLSSFVQAMVRDYNAEAIAGLPGYTAYSGMRTALETLAEQDIPSIVVTANSATGVGAILQREALPIMDLRSGFDLQKSKFQLFLDVSRAYPGRVMICAGDTLHDADHMAEAAAQSSSPFVSTCVVNEHGIIPPVYSATRFDVLVSGSTGLQLLPSALSGHSKFLLITDFVESTEKRVLNDNTLTPQATQVALSVLKALSLRSSLA
ncbi:MAG: hypothetical protein AAB066_04980 [Candidatus Margulisiibacteriota bacterium]